VAQESLFLPHLLLLPQLVLLCQCFQVGLMPQAMEVPPFLCQLLLQLVLLSEWMRVAQELLLLPPPLPLPQLVLLLQCSWMGLLPPPLLLLLPTKWR